MPQRVRVKLLSRALPGFWLRYFDDPTRLVRGNCEFLFDSETADYDWVVVYEQFPRGGRMSGTAERLQCGSENTLLITTEPPTIKRYPRVFTEQFGHVLTTHPEDLLPHRNRIYSQPALKWFYGTDRDGGIPISQLESERPRKTGMLSTVCSAKQQGHTLHHRRYTFVQEMRSEFADLEVFGHGVRPIHDKAEALRPYRYHLAIENYVGKHHWTEKLSDSFLGFCLPMYFGCPNAADYFPEDSFIPIDIDEPGAAADTIRQAIRDDWYSERLSAVQEARRLVLEDYNLFSVIERLITERHQTNTQTGGRLHTRHQMRFRHPLQSIPTALGSEFRTLMGRILPR